MSQIEDLKPLFDGTPLAVERIVAIWPGLSIPDKASLFTALMASKGAINCSPHSERFLDLLLGDDNPFIRYQAARHVYRPREGATQDAIARYARVQNDPSPLVRSAEVEFRGWKTLNFQPDYFWGLPQTLRLAAVTGIHHEGEKFTALLLFASEHLLPAGQVTEDEMADVALQYLTWETVEKRLKDTSEYAESFADGWADYSAGKSLTAMWEAIPALPREVGAVLLRHLPEEGGLAGGVGSSVLDALDIYQKRVLLYRQDIRLDSWRRDQFENSEDKDNRLAALANPRFKLDDSAITALVYRPEDPLEEALRKFDALRDLANAYQGASMAQSSGIAKLIRDAPEAVSDARMFSDHFAFQICEKRVKTLAPNALEGEYRELQLLEMAWALAPMSGGISDRCPGVLMQYMVAGSPWDTYLRLKEAARTARNHSKEGFELKRAIEDHRAGGDFGFTIPAELYADPADPVAESQQEALMRVLPLKLNELGAGLDRTKTLLWAVIAGLVVFVLFKH